jgi:hypothetical protein
VPPSGISYLPTPTELRNIVPRGYLPIPQNYGTWCRESVELHRDSGEISKSTEHDRAWRGTYPLRITERRHRNLPSLAKERNPGGDARSNNTECLGVTFKTSIEKFRACGCVCTRHAHTRAMPKLEPYLGARRAGRASNLACIEGHGRGFLFFSVSET